jgi:Cna protein B-type domain.
MNAYCTDPDYARPDAGYYSKYWIKSEYVARVAYYMYGAPGFNTVPVYGTRTIKQYIDDQVQAYCGRSATTNDYLTVSHYALAYVAGLSNINLGGYIDPGVAVPEWIKGIHTRVVQDAPQAPLGFKVYFILTSPSGTDTQNVWGWEYSVPYQVTLEKTKNGGDLTGVKYGLFKSDDTQIATFTLDANGKTADITFESTPTGIDGKYVIDGKTYLVWDSTLDTQNWYFKELESNNNYAVNVTNKNFTVKRGKQTITVDDVPAKGMVQVFKVDEDNNPIQGCKFKLYHTYNDALNDINSIAETTTSAWGLANFVDLPSGNYYVKETGIPDGSDYIKDETPQGPLNVTNDAQQTISKDGVYYGYVFKAKYYAGTYADVRAAFGNDIAKLGNHFLSNGINEGKKSIQELRSQHIYE